MYLAFSVVFPLFTMMALGYFLRAIKLFDEKFLEKLNNLCFKVFLPTTLFMNIYTSEFKGDFQWNLIGFALISIATSFALLIIIIPLLTKQNTNKSVMIQGMFRSNFVLFGLPMTASLFGSNNVSVTAIMMAFVIPLFNILSVIALEIFSPTKSNTKTIIKGIVKNPLIIASILAFILAILEIKFPAIIISTLTDISKIATPLSLIVLGGSFVLSNILNSGKLLAIAALGKLIIIPLIFLPIAIAFGFRGVELGSLLAMFASPTAVSSYTMAQSRGANHELAGQIVVVGSIFAILTIFLWISILKQMGFI